MTPINSDRFNSDPAARSLPWHDQRVSPSSPFVFVHGLFGPFNDHSTFRQLSPAPCSAPDLDGYGRGQGRPVTLAGQVEQLRSHILQRYRGQRVNLIGHSIGAVYAFTLADESPELVHTVTTVEGNFSLRSGHAPSLP
jgi:pimeloyl-ACP methyl ester carboxylesterase